MSPDDLVHLWRARLGDHAEVESIAALAGVSIQAAHAALERQSVTPVESQVRSTRAIPARVVIARTLDLLERRFSAVAVAPERTKAARRYALLCLHDLLRRGGRIDQLHEIPWPLSEHWRNYVLHGRPLEEEIEKRIARFHARARAWSRRYVERAATLRSRYAGLLPCPDWRSSFFAISDPDASWPALPTPWSAEEAREGIKARFGPSGQMLAMSKSRAPWASRCVFNGQIKFADTGELIWSGDLWLLPPDDAQFDPRRGALDIARAAGRSVAMSSESGTTPIWIAHPDGRLEVTTSGMRVLESVVRLLDQAGWPGFREWPNYPIEHRVRAAATRQGSSSTRRPPASGSRRTR